MLKRALVWILAFGIGFVGLNYGLMAAFWIVLTIAVLAIGIPFLSARRKDVQPVVEE